jgi:hypothetical protein
MTVEMAATTSAVMDETKASTYTLTTRDNDNEPLKTLIRASGLISNMALIDIDAHE